MVWLWTLILGCGTRTEPVAPDLTVAEVAGYVRGDVAEPEGWARDVRAALRAAGQPVDADHVCQVLATVEQESGYDPDPEVPGLGRIAREALEEELDVAGLLGDLGVEWLLAPVAEGAERTFAARLAEVRTERELDELFRELAAHHTRAADGVPLVDGLLQKKIERLNPVTTAGSMQVSVAWAQDRAREEDLPPSVVRDLLYTRAGGLEWGTRRLFAHPDAAYDDPIHRFADFNAGVYASRNAAFQTQLADVTGLELVPDGDLMRWTRQGRPRPGATLDALLAWRDDHAPELTDARIRRDARHEKTAAFEDTVTWAGVRATWEAEHGSEPAYARVPDIALDSPKITRDWTTRWFAESVQRRYRACLSRG